MYGLVVTLVWLLEPASARSPLVGGRPAECASGGSSAWERAKQPNLRRYCDLLASGASKLAGAGAGLGDVPALVDEADALVPGRSAPPVLKGRALLRLGRPDEARAALAEGLRRDARALDDPSALLDWARASARTGHLAEAAEAYRAALPRASALSARERGRASFEAAMAAMASPGRGAEGLDDAVAMLRQARRDAEDAVRAAAVLALALALDRAGRGDEARAALGDRGRGEPRASLEDPSVREALADAGAASEREALLAVSHEPNTQPCREAWRRYVAGDGGKGAWADHARARAGLSPSTSSRGGR